MKFNKIVALALALVMVFALCACGAATPIPRPTTPVPLPRSIPTPSPSARSSSRATTFRTDQIYAFVSTIFNNLDAIAAQHGKGAELNLEGLQHRVKGRRITPGAAKYFEGEGRQGRRGQGTAPAPATASLRST